MLPNQTNHQKNPFSSIDIGATQSPPSHQAVEAFALAYGGATKFDIPTCSDLRKFRRNEAMRTRFDELIKKGFSSNQAVQDITIEFTPITTRQVQVILNSASHRS